MAEADDDADPIYGMTVIYGDYLMTVHADDGSHTMPTTKGGTEPTGDFPQYRCRGDRAGVPGGPLDVAGGCRAFGHNVVDVEHPGSGESFSIWMCACCQGQAGLRPGLDLLVSGEVVRLDGTDYMMRSGSRAMLEAYHARGALNVRSVDIDGLDDEACQRRLIEGGLLRSKRTGARRGSVHYGCPNPALAKDLLSQVDGIREEFQRCQTLDENMFPNVASMTPIAGAIPALYGRTNKWSYEGLGEVSFCPHSDRRYVGKPSFRSNLMGSEREEGLEPKTTLFQDRNPNGEFAGQHIELVCFAGNTLDMREDIAGVRNKWIQNSVWNAEGTMTITYDWGPRIPNLSDAELRNAAIEAFDNDDEPDEEEVEGGEQGQGAGEGE